MAEFHVCRGHLGRDHERFAADDDDLGLEHLDCIPDHADFELIGDGPISGARGSRRDRFQDDLEKEASNKLFEKRILF